MSKKDDIIKRYFIAVNDTLNLLDGYDAVLSAASQPGATLLPESPEEMLVVLQQMVAGVRETLHSGLNA